MQEKIVVTRNLNKKLQEIRKKAFQVEIQTTIAMCNAASIGDIETIKKLHESGVSLDQGDYDNRTPLHVASGGGHTEVVKYLLDNGAFTSPVDRWGATPLCDA